MCDYSLESYQSRPAIAGEDLDLVRFPSGSQGFVGHGANTSCAVCCEEGMTMTLHMPSGDVDVVFSKDRRPMLSWVSEPSFRHKDGVRFPDGSYRLLQELPAMRATVIKPLPEAIIEAAAGTVAFEPEVRIAQVEASVDAEGVRA